MGAAAAAVVSVSHQVQQAQQAQQAHQAQQVYQVQRRNQEAAAQHSAYKEARVNNVSSQLDALTRQRGNFSNQTICGCCFPSRGRSCWLTIWGRCFPGSPLRDKQSVDGTIFGCGIVFGRVTFRLRSLYNLQSRAFYQQTSENLPTIFFLLSSTRISLSKSSQ